MSFYYRLYIGLIIISMYLGMGICHADSSPDIDIQRILIPSNHTELKAWVFKPVNKPPSHTMPAIVALHGCSGLYTKGKLNARFKDWGELLAGHGYLVIFPDSFGSRGLESQCSNSVRSVRPGVERVKDAYQTKRYIESLQQVNARRIYLMGWSNGGSTVLYAVQPQWRKEAGKHDFASAVAFYPGCKLPLQRATAYTRLPLTIMIGGADNWTPAAPCHSLQQAARSLREPINLIVFPDAYHDFDHPHLKVQQRHGLAYTADHTGTAYIGSNSAAREKAHKEVLALFSP